MIPGLLELAAFLGTSLVIARGVDWCYRGNEGRSDPASSPSADRTSDRRDGLDVILTPDDGQRPCGWTII